MKKNSLEHFVTSTKDQWMTPDLLGKLQTSPALMQGLADPEVMQAVALMQARPAEAKEKFKNNKKVTEFFVEFSKLMGGHFENLGEKEDAKSNVEPQKPKLVETKPEVQMKKIAEVPKAKPEAKQTPLLTTPDPVLAKKLEDPTVKVKIV